MNGKHLLRSLDLSHNEFGSTGCLKLLSRLKKSTAIVTLNLSGNDLSEDHERFISLEKFLSRNESCKHLLLNNCRLKRPVMALMSIGLSKNTTLERLSLSENIFCDKESMQYLAKGLLENA